MLPSQDANLKRDWERAWSDFDAVLTDLGFDSQGEPWDLWALATFLDVPGFALAGLVREMRASGLTRGFDLVERVRAGVSRALTRLPPDQRAPLPLEFGLTATLLRWEWAELVEAGETDWDFFDRLRELRIRIPEVTLCERTVHLFCTRVAWPPGPG